MDLAFLFQGLAVTGLEGPIGEQTISRVMELDGAKAGSLCFLSSRKHLNALDGSKATACVCPAELAEHVGQHNIIPVISDAPKAHFGRAVSRLYTEAEAADTNPKGDANIHETASVGAGAKIGSGTTIGAYTVIGRNVVIGRDCHIGSHCTIENTFMGCDCEIKAHAVIGGNGLGVARDETGSLAILHVGMVRLGDRVRIGSHTCVDRAMIGETVLEDDVKLDNLIQIAHNVSVGAGTVMASFVGIPGSCTIGKGVMIGGQAGIADHLTIGDGASLAGGSGLMHDIPAGEKWGGYPAMPIRDWMRLVSRDRKAAKPTRRLSASSTGSE